MKITAEHRAVITKALDAAAAESSFETRLLQSELKPMTVRWNMFFVGMELIGQPDFVCDVLYAYADDFHIETVIKAYFKA